MKNNNVALFSADYPNFISGTGDYSYLLRKHLEMLGVRVHLVTSDVEIIDSPIESLKVKWRLRDIFEIYMKLREWRVSIINIQYPNILYRRYSLVPHFYAVVFRILGYKIITTIHEYSNVTFLRRISEVIFFIFSHAIIITSDIEKGNIEQSFGFFLKNKTTTINIGPNIETLSIQPNYSSNIIVTFGMFYPDKCVEEVIDFMEQIDKKNKGRFVFRFIGGFHVHYQGYFEKCKSTAIKKLTKTEWVINKSGQELSNSIRDAFIGVLFYNDGVSVRRGSLLTLIENGTPIISNKINSCPEFSAIENNGLFYSNDKEKGGFHYFEKLLKEPEFYADCYKSLKRTSANFTFDNIAQKYRNMFSNVET